MKNILYNNNYNKLIKEKLLKKLKSEKELLKNEIQNDLTEWKILNNVIILIALITKVNNKENSIWYFNLKNIWQEFDKGIFILNKSLFTWFMKYGRYRNQ